jgi:hypothetical protein
MWRVHLENLVRFGMLGYRMYVIRENFDGSFALVKPPLILEAKPPHSFAGPEDALIDDSRVSTYEDRTDVRGFLQAMSDAAWEIGIKPKQMESHASELTAVRYHLEDMRQLAGVKQIAGAKQ